MAQLLPPVNASGAAAYRVTVASASENRVIKGGCDIQLSAHRHMSMSLQRLPLVGAANDEIARRAATCGSPAPERHGV
jgi:hypothetical protein